MPLGLLPTPADAAAAAPTDPQAVVEAFLAALADTDLAAALALVDDHLVYTNVGLPTVHGKAQLAKVFAAMERPEAGFEVYLHAITAEGAIVLTERTDVILFGRLRAQFWVCGRFDVHDGKITLWRDAFDFVDILRGTVRGLAGIVLPSLRPKAPTDLRAAPGRPPL
ncbi:limonene-1,2-epoxide hydrolase family protein [Aquihabitans sp. McL0605]|uniref:limonene-1,2-epoxide hydrolase family protein n=1 Tax=Aquihabitans sp. McL0605 TaxID=3415671 RepID=UPI003CF47F14